MTRWRDGRGSCAQLRTRMAGEGGIEPPRATLDRRCSTTKLLPGTGCTSCV